VLSGVVFLDKPLGWTSRKAVNEVMRLFGGKKAGIKAGHGGTLDPLATGMLPILLGEATRFASLGLDATKVYEVTLDLSYQTDTLDREGEVVARYDTSVGDDEIRTAVSSFVGIQQQTPPVYSAIKIDGKRAHELARAGKEVEIKPREIEIYAIDILGIEFPSVSLRVSCSKGTYIRSLSDDIGTRLGMGGCVTMLRRISTGGWPAELMVTPEELEERREACILPLADWLRALPRIELAEPLARRFLQGQRIACDTAVASGELAAIFHGELLLGTAEVKQGERSPVLHPKRILPTAQRSL